jgi:hypothetical protein
MIVARVGSGGRHAILGVALAALVCATVCAGGAVPARADARASAAVTRTHRAVTLPARCRIPRGRRTATCRRAACRRSARPARTAACRRLLRPRRPARAPARRPAAPARPAPVGAGAPSAPVVSPPLVGDTAPAATIPGTPTVPSPPATPTAPVQPVEARATTDRPDERTGRQVHLVYAVASDGVDDGLDTSGAIAASFAAAQGWLGTQTGGRILRLDTSQGAPDVTFRRLDEDEAALADRGVGIRNDLEADLHAHGLNDPDKIYLVYYEGEVHGACANGPWPPTTPGTVAGVYLHGEVPPAPDCATNRLAGPGDPPGYWEFGAIHEVMHALGLVPECAPHAGLFGHVTDDPRDLMYAGSQPWRPSILDVDHDDYYDAGIPGCADLATSGILTSG